MKKYILTLFAILFSAATAQAAFIFSVRDRVPNGASGNGTRTLTTTAGSVSAPAGLPTMTYTISNLDLTSVGGTASETIVFDVDYSSPGSLQFSSWGNISVTGGGDNNKINVGQEVTSTVSLNSTTYGGTVSLGFTRLDVGGLGNNHNYVINHDGGTISPSPASPGSRIHTLPVSSFITLDQTVGNSEFQGFDVEVTVIPEPGTLVLVGLAGLVVVLGLRRRRIRAV